MYTHQTVDVEVNTGSTRFAHQASPEVELVFDPVSQRFMAHEKIGLPGSAISSQEAGVVPSARIVRIADHVRRAWPGYLAVACLAFGAGANLSTSQPEDQAPVPAPKDATPAPTVAAVVSSPVAPSVSAAVPKHEVLPAKAEGVLPAQAPSTVSAPSAASSSATSASPATVLSVQPSVNPAAAAYGNQAAVGYGSPPGYQPPAYAPPAPAYAPVPAYVYPQAYGHPYAQPYPMPPAYVPPPAYAPPSSALPAPLAMPAGLPQPAAVSASSKKADRTDGDDENTFQDDSRPNAGSNKPNATARSSARSPVQGGSAGSRTTPPKASKPLATPLSDRPANAPSGKDEPVSSMAAFSAASGPAASGAATTSSPVSAGEATVSAAAAAGVSVGLVAILPNDKAVVVTDAATGMPVKVKVGEKDPSGKVLKKFDAKKGEATFEDGDVIYLQ